MVLQRYYIIFVTSQSFYWSCRIVCPYLWMNIHRKLIDRVLLLELWEVLFVLQSGHQESVGTYFECIQQCNKIRLEQLGGGGGGGTCCQCATKKIYKICFSPKDTSPKCLFLLNTDFIISDGNCDSLRRQTILLSNTIDLTRAQICFSVSQERATLCIRGRLHN